MTRGQKRVFFALCAVLGVVGAVESIGPVRAAVQTFTCSTSTPCLNWQNTSSGNGVRGLSTTGSGVDGRTKFASSDKSAGQSGVLGEDLSTSGTLNSGVTGTSVNGTGVTGNATGSSSQNAVAGISASTFGSGVYGQNSSTGYGVAGRNISAHHNAGVGVLADGGAADDGLHAFSVGATAVYANSQTGSALFAAQGANATAAELYLYNPSSSLSIEGANASGPTFDVGSDGHGYFSGGVSTNNGIAISAANSSFGEPTGDTDTMITIFTGGHTSNNSSFVIFDPSVGGDQFAVAQNGNVSIGGILTTQGSCNTGCVAGGKRLRTVSEYAPLEAEPTIEDNGEAALVNGVANVPLDPRFANVIDKSADYLVTVTPEGDCQGLYVAQRTATGFTIRELRNGHASLNFAYRIVARRYGVAAPRLPMTDVIIHHPAHTSGQHAL